MLLGIWQHYTSSQDHKLLVRLVRASCQSHACTNGGHPKEYLSNEVSSGAMRYRRSLRGHEFFMVSPHKLWPGLLGGSCGLNHLEHVTLCGCYTFLSSLHPFICRHRIGRPSNVWERALTGVGMMQPLSKQAAMQRHFAVVFLSNFMKSASTLQTKHEEPEQRQKVNLTQLARAVQVPHLELPLHAQDDLGDLHTH